MLPCPCTCGTAAPGCATSMFGTYVRRGELLVYPFFEYYRDDDFEYKPSELGAPGEEDYRGRYRAKEGLLSWPTASGRTSRSRSRRP